ncbi:F-box/LRR-repeat protein At3g26922-like [Prunus avium]|uniref:F-box/LRR-repeat protein At3g26922-like n=1 Tax=Prunus avium TaxID=42229 RepID=A0A6P5TXV9_PRUAV|nr:F-box/LRR-repeat protein At3g26922-like [Prunus avium]
MDEIQESLEANRDRISELPDCIGSYIMSKLTIKDLVTTSVLSKRWLRMWKLRRNLVFDIPNMFNIDLPPLWEGAGLDMDHEFLDQVTDEYVRRVDQFVQTFPGPKIDSFRLTHYIDVHKYVSFVDKWVARAIAMGVEEIAMLSYPSFTTFYVPKMKRPYSFPFRLLPVCNKKYLKHLYLDSCNLMPSSQFFAAFYYLITLRLEATLVGEDFMISLLSNSPFLQVLRLKSCKLPSALEIVGPSLHHLEVIDCRYKGNVTISAPKLTVFEHRNLLELENILPLNAPQLRKIFFHAWEERMIPPSISHFTGFAQLEYLNLRMTSGEMPRLPGNIAPLRKLKQLELSVDEGAALGCSNILWVVLFLKASPLLQKLTYRRPESPPGFSENERSERWQPEEFTHNQLKEVEIAGCVGNWFEVELAICMLQNVQGLEQMVLNPSQRYYYGGGSWIDDEQSTCLGASRYWAEGPGNSC